MVGNGDMGGPPGVGASMSVSVGFLGLGRMGSRMARNVARAGFPVVLYNRTRSKAEELAKELGAGFRETPAEVAAETDVIVSMLADGPAVEAVYTGPSGVVDAIRPGAVAVDMSTVGPGVVRGLAARVEDRGARMVDAPVSGSTASAEAGKLLIMAGGDGAAVDRVRPVLEAMGSPVLHVGPLGAGQAMKLAVNTLIYGLNQALSEALVLAERSGIDRHVAYDVFAQSAAAAPVVHYRRPVFERPEEAPVMFTMDLGLKDLRLILELAEQVGAPMPQAEGNMRAMEAAVGAGHGGDDIGGMARFLRSRSAEAGEAGPSG